MNKALLDKIIIKMENEGFKIYFITFDLGNKTILHQLGFTKGEYYFQHPLDPARIIYIIPDVPHVLKLARNHLLDHGFWVPNEDKTQLVHLGIEDFRAILEKDNSEYKATKLTEYHLNVKGSDRQRVRPAAQVLSGKVAKAFIFNDESEEAKAKSNAVQLFNDWFDVMGSSRVYDKNKLKCGLGVHKKEQFDVLHKMEEFMDLMEVDKGQDDKIEINGVVYDFNDPNIDWIQVHIDERASGRNLVNHVDSKNPIKINDPKRKKPALIPWQHAIKCIIKAVRGLFIDLVENGPLDCILTKRLDQDCLENLFSQIRALEGSNDHPSALVFMRRIRIIQIGRNVVILVENPAVQMEAQDEAIAQEEEEIVSKFVTKDIPVAYVYELEDDATIPDCEYGSTIMTGEIPDVRAHADDYHRTNLGSQIEAYVAGYFAQKFKDKYDLGVKKSELTDEDQEHLDKFPWLKLLAKGGLYVPHQEWLDDFRQFEAEFTDFHEADINRGAKIIDRFASQLESKFNDKYDKSLYKSYAEFRTHMRIKSLNKKSINSGSDVTVVRRYKQLGQFES